MVSIIDLSMTRRFPHESSEWEPYERGDLALSSDRQKGPLLTLSPNRSFQLWGIEEGDGEIRWHPPATGLSGLVEPGMHYQFAALHDAEVGGIAEYARRWGPLYICEHGFPSLHRQQQPSAGTGMWAGCDLLVASDDPPQLVFREPVEAWRRYARAAAAILNIGNALLTDEVARVEDWTVVETDWIVAHGGTPSRQGPSWYIDRPVDEQRMYVSGFVNEWMVLGGVVPKFVWTQQNPSVGLETRTMFGTVGVMLAQTLMGSHVSAQCGSCHRFYAPKRRPKTGQRNYCGTCRAGGVPVRDAKRDQRAREQAGAAASR